MSTRFDLTDEAWVPLHMLDGAILEVSLRDAFAHSGRARALSGELPTVSFALLRLMLAILHRSVDGPRDIEQWADLWEGADLPIDKIDGYLGRHRDRFDLLSAETPFYQVAGLAKAKAEPPTLEALIADVPNNIRLFPNRHGSALASISYAEAARWLVHAQAFETSGIRGAAVGDPRMKGGKVYPIGTGWAGAIGGVFVEGATLRETLLLNLGTADRNDLPVWERPPQTAYEEVPGGRPATGPVDAYTWQKARIRLIERDGAVVGAVVTNGDRADLFNRHNIEPMTAWRRSANQEKAAGTEPIYLPIRHDPTRLFWRGLSAFLPRVAEGGSGKEAARNLSPGVASWLAKLIDGNALPGDLDLRMHAVGLEYGPQQAVISELIDDVLTFSGAALSLAHPDIKYEIDAALDKAGKACWALGVYAENVAKAEIGDAAGDSGTARVAAERVAVESSAYAALDAPFRSWLAALNPSVDLGAAREQWLRQLRKIVLKAAGGIASQAPPQAYVTRPPTHSMCLPIADRNLRAYLSREHILTRTEESNA